MVGAHDVPMKELKMPIVLLFPVSKFAVTPVSTFTVLTLHHSHMYDICTGRIVAAGQGRRAPQGMAAEVERLIQHPVSYILTLSGLVAAREQKGY